jgi:Flp pilus assembly protein TadG
MSHLGSTGAGPQGIGVSVMGHSRGRGEKQRGQILVLFTLMIVLLMGLAAIVVDVGVLRRSSAELAGAVDAAALAAGAQLPATSANAANITKSAVDFLNANYPGLGATYTGATSPWVGYRCLVETTSATSRLPDTTQIPTVCQPGSSLTWTCNASVCTTPCNPTVTGNSCNVVVVGGTKNVGYRFGPAIGTDNGSTGTVQSAACVDSCMGPPTAPLDVMVIIDRTGSMDGAPLKNAKGAARDMLLAFNPAFQYVGLGVLPPSYTASDKLSKDGTVDGYACKAGAYSEVAPLDHGAWPSNVTWTPVNYPTLGLANNYQDTATKLKEGSALVNTINCLTSASYTDQGTAVLEAARVLNDHGSGRPGVKKAIVLLTDGRPQNNESADGTGVWTCSNANTQATAAKGSDIELYTIGFFDTGDHGTINIPDCPDKTGSSIDSSGKNWRGLTAVDLLSAMSTLPVKGTTACNAAENTDEDHFFCLPKTEDLTATFRKIATSLASGVRLIALP